MDDHGCSYLSFKHGSLDHSGCARHQVDIVGEGKEDTRRGAARRGGWWIRTARGRIKSQQARTWNKAGTLSIRGRATYTHVESNLECETQPRWRRRRVGLGH